MDLFELTDDVVLLRAPGEGDIEVIYTACQDPDIQQWTTAPTPYLPEHAERFVRECVPGGGAGGSPTWAIRELAADGALAGTIGLTSQAVRSAEIGWWLAPQYRGRGLMARSVDLVLGAAFGHLGLDRVEWRAYAGNSPSRAVAERAGFCTEGCIRGGAVKDDVRVDDWVGTLLSSDRR